MSDDKRNLIDAIINDEVYYLKHENKYDNGDAVDRLLDLDKQTWNAAIDAAANKVEGLGSFAIAHEVRKLRK